MNLNTDSNLNRFTKKPPIDFRVKAAAAVEEKKNRWKGEKKKKKIK